MFRILIINEIGLDSYIDRNQLESAIGSIDIRLIEELKYSNIEIEEGE